MAKNKITVAKVRMLRTRVLSYYTKNGRHTLPWRKTKNPYRILVSEVMLQQTQVERVIPYYKKWIKRFPTARSLAKASLKEVLIYWSGLGYNSRAKRLLQAARSIGSSYKGRFPREYTAILALPGVGPYTASAIMAFAYNHDVVMIETNIRTVLMHHLFARRKNVSDSELTEVLRTLTPKGKAREWYSALMDYGSYLKAQGVRTNSKSKHYTKQGAFAGSNREVRGAIIRAISKGAMTDKQLLKLFESSRVTQVKDQLKALQKEGMIEKAGRLYHLPS